MMKRVLSGILCTAILAANMTCFVRAAEGKDLTHAAGQTSGEESSGLLSQDFETPCGLSALDFAAYCDAYFGEKVKDEIPGASIAVVSKGKIVFEKGYGYSDIENEKVSSPAVTVYEYGSVSKLFTWISLMQLTEQGKVDLNTDIRQYLPADFEVPTSYEKPITILDLMNHQGGFDDYLIHLFGQKDNMVSLRESLEEHKVQQVFEPGFASSYSNYGAGLAGYIVENVAGIPEYDYVENHVFKPAGMEQATLNPDIYSREDIIQNKAKTYEKTGDGFSEENWTLVSMYPAGAANGTVEELADFALALLSEDHPLFETAQTQQELLSTSGHGAEGVAGIAHGFVEYDGEKMTYWHNGGTDHSSTFFAVVPELDFGIAICTNSGNLSSIQSFGFEMLAKREVKLDTPMENLPSTDEVEGSYQDFREDHRGIARMITLPRYLFPIQVKAVDAQHITLDGSTYLQVEPYVYQDVDTGEKISFEVQDGKVIKYSYMLDYIRVPQYKIILAWVKAAVLGSFALMLPVTTVCLAVKLIKRKFRKRDFFLVGNVTGWCLLLSSILILILRITEWETFAAIMPQLYVNRGLAITLLGVSVIGIWKELRKKDGQKRSRLMLLHLSLSCVTLWVLASLGGLSIYY